MKRRVSLDMALRLFLAFSLLASQVPSAPSTSSAATTAYEARRQLTKRPATFPTGGAEKLDRRANTAPTLSKELFIPKLHRTPEGSISNDKAGQSATLLPDGRLLLIGGEGPDGPLAAAAIRDPRTGAVFPLPNGLRHPRAWHTAALLPNGAVLVLGGLGANGGVVETAEQFDLERQTFEELQATGLIPRAHHTTTVLTEGRVLIAGGVSAQNETLGQLELWDPKARNAAPVAAELLTPRRGHTATLLPDGSVIFWGGADKFGTPLNYGEIFDPKTQALRMEISPLQMQADTRPPRLNFSLPEDGAVDVSLDSFIALRFSKPLLVETVNAGTATLSDPQGVVAAKVIPAEAGMLAFLTPEAPLLSGTTYTLSLAGLRDASGLTLPDTLLTFRTAGPSAVEEAWIPGAGGWTTGRPDSPWQKLPPLQAPPGATGLAGQVLKLNGDPLQNVTLRIDGNAVRTDHTGRFLLAPLTAGHQVMLIDGRTASTPQRTYGVFEVGVSVTAGRTNALSYTIWMPLLDMAHAVTIPSPTLSELVVATPLLPGLELHIPAGTVIRDHEGQVVTQVSITPVPLDRPPFPLPAGVDVPIYFTIQPGAAYLNVSSATGPNGARLIYPNSRNARPGTVFDFWNYDADEKGWFIYGQGKVAPEGRQIQPDPGVVIYEFTGAMVASPGLAPSKGPPPCPWYYLWFPCGKKGGDPVDLATGLFVLDSTDLYLPDVLPINLTRTYRPADSISRAFGIGTTHPYDLFLAGDTFPYTFADLILPDGGRVHYVRTSPGTSYADAVYQHTASPTAFYGSTISWNGNGWDLKLKDGTVYVFGSGFNATRPQQGAVISMRDRYANTLSVTRDSNFNVTQITSPNGRWIQFTYDASNRVTQAKDNMGRVVSYTYDASGRLSTVTDANGGITTYTYDASNNMLTIQDARGIVYLTNQYDANNRVIRQTQVDNTTYQFAYTVDANGNITQANVTDPRGNVRQVAFNSAGYALSETFALGKPEQQAYTYNIQAGTNLMLSVTDALNRQTSFTYDALGNTTSVTRLAGTANAITSSLAYDATFSQVTSVTDPLNHTTSFAYDVKGNLITATDPIGNSSTFTYNFAGQVVSATDPVGNTTQFAYEAGDLAAVTDPLGRTVRGFLDAVGRLAALTNPVGQITRFDYDALNQPIRLTDALGGVTSLSYDANGNLLSVTDPRNTLNPTTYSYDNMDRLATRKDPLLNQASYQYDANGNLTSFTDRRGAVTTFSYDALNRRTFAGFGTQSGPSYESTVSYTYDAGNRLSQIVDSITGTITPTFDNLNRLSAVVTPQGAVGYTYDNAGRRATMTVAGQPAVNYTFDNANRLTQIGQGVSTVSYAYDAANRRTSLTLSSGVVVGYGYDAASQLVSLTYQIGATALGDLAYAYDVAGRRVQVGGSFARTGLPLPVTATAYNANNQLTQWGTTTLTYDANGNMLSSGTDGYTWDARNHLVSTLSGVSFQYDPFGRRVSKTIAGVTTNYLYDRANVVQELSGSTPAANLLSGGIDEVFTRTDSAGARSFLTDALGSTLALTDSTGTMQTQYTYEPYGNTTATGAASGNPYQYTGRENDGAGLYYYRARYYQPTLQRFIAEDPIGLNGGPNLYAYVGNNPIGFADPLGLKPGPRPWGWPGWLPWPWGSPGGGPPQPKPGPNQDPSCRRYGWGVSCGPDVPVPMLEAIAPQVVRGSAVVADPLFPLEWYGAAASGPVLVELGEGAILAYAGLQSLGLLIEVEAPGITLAASSFLQGLATNGPIPADENAFGLYGRYLRGVLRAIRH